MSSSESPTDFSRNVIYPVPTRILHKNRFNPPKLGSITRLIPINSKNALDRHKLPDSFGPIARDEKEKMAFQKYGMVQTVRNLALKSAFFSILHSSVLLRFNHFIPILCHDLIMKLMKLIPRIHGLLSTL